MFRYFTKTKQKLASKTKVCLCKEIWDEIWRFKKKVDVYKKNSREHLLFQYFTSFQHSYPFSLPSLIALYEIFILVIQKHKYRMKFFFSRNGWIYMKNCTNCFATLNQSVRLLQSVRFTIYSLNPMFTFPEMCRIFSGLIHLQQIQLQRLFCCVSGTEQNISQYSY